MALISFIGIDENITDKEISEMIEYLYTASILIRSGCIRVVWNRWLKPDCIAVDAVIEKFRKRILERFPIIPNTGIKNGVCFPEDIVWETHDEVYVLGTIAEVKNYIESFSRLDKSRKICNENEVAFNSPYIYVISAEYLNTCVAVQNLGFLFKQES